MNNRSSTLAFYGTLIAIALGLILLNWVNYTIAENAPSGEYFSVYWLSTRAFLEDGLSPYSTQTAALIGDFAEIQGYPVDPSLHRFQYPLYLQAFILPFALISDYTIAQVAWMSFLEISLLLLAWFCLSMAGWRSGLELFALLGFFAIFNYLSVSQIFGGSIIVVVALFLVLAFTALRRGLDELAGVLLALTTILPLVVLPIIVFVFFWAVTARRARLFAWLAGSLILLSGISLLFLKDWPVQYYDVVSNLPAARYFSSPQAAFRSAFPGLGVQMGWVLTGFASLTLLFEWWLTRGKEYRWFLWTACLTLTLTPWTGLPTETGNLVLLLIPMFLIFSQLEERWGQNFRPFLLVTLFISLTALWLPFAWNLPDTLIARLYPLLFLIVPLFMFLGLYWVRWWAVRPRRTFISELKARDDF